MMITFTIDNEACELIVHTPQGIIVINECHNPMHFTRVALSPISADGYVSMSHGKPAVMGMWSGIQVNEPQGVQFTEPEVDPDATEEILPLFDEDEETGH